MTSFKRFIIIFLLPACMSVQASGASHFSCVFGQSIYIDSRGLYEAPKWKSKGFSVNNNKIIFDSGDLELKLTTNIQKGGIAILRGADPKKGYQFSLENERFVYVSLITPLGRTWTVTGTCKKDD